MKKYSTVTVCMIVVIAMAIVWVFLHTETNQNAWKRQFQEDWEKSFWAGGWWTGLVGSSEPQVFFFLALVMSTKWLHILHLSQCMRFPTMWYVRQAKPQISLRIHAVWSEPLLVAWIFYDCKLLTGHRLEFLSFKGGCTGSSESTLDKMPHCWKSHVTTHLLSEHYQLML